MSQDDEARKNTYRSLFQGSRYPFEDLGLHFVEHKVSTTKVVCIKFDGTAKEIMF